MSAAARRAFLIPSIISLLLLAFVWSALGVVAFGTAILLVVLEVTLSFDNAIVNAGILKRMNHFWRVQFLLWGIIFAVVVTRLLLPILIVAAGVSASPLYIAQLALNDPKHYGELLESAKYGINAFGALFLLMVSLKYFFNKEKQLHWIASIEERLSKWGSIEAIEIALALLVLFLSAFFVPEHQAQILFAGVLGIFIFIVAHGITALFDKRKDSGESGFALFAYLCMLDVAFSLDSVIGAFALSTDLLVIMIGLGIGAYFVRAFTVYMVDNGTLERIKYIEQGAHWAILGLAVVMIAGLFVSVPEPLTGFIGLSFIVGAYISSARSAVSKTSVINTQL